MARVPRFCAGAIVRYSPSMRAIVTVQKRGAGDDLPVFWAAGTGIMRETGALHRDVPDQKISGWRQV